MEHLQDNKKAERLSNAEIRAKEVLKRLPDTPNPIGAEIGVYKGNMSRALLAMNSNLRLIMVDSWAGRNKATADYIGTGDPRATESHEQALKHMRRAIINTEFAIGRRIIIHKPSVKASIDVADQTLDFVFLDADHSYHSTKIDIITWMRTLAPNGLMGGHDYQPKFPGVIQAVNECADQFDKILELGKNNTWFYR